MKIHYRGSSITFAVMAFLWVLVEADYIFSIKLLSYSNPSNTLANGSCCEEHQGGSCTTQCDTSLHFCVRNISHPQDDLSCPILEITSQTSPGTLNPLQLRGAWPGSVQLHVRAMTDENSPKLIDDVFIVLNVTANDGLSPNQSYTGDFGTATVELSVQVDCVVNYYGLDCSTFCMARDDAKGHYTCNTDTGAFICNAGYRNESSECRECVPANGCSPTGGYCMFPGECLCRDGYSGSNCTDPIVTTTPVLISQMSSPLSNVFTTEPPTVTQIPDPSSVAAPFNTISQLIPSPSQTTASDNSITSPTLTALPMQSKSNRVPTAVGATVGSVALLTLLIVVVVVIVVCASKQRGNFIISRDKGTFIESLYRVNANQEYSKRPVLELQEQPITATEKRRSKLLDFLVVNRGHRGRTTTLPGVIYNAYHKDYKEIHNTPALGDDPCSSTQIHSTPTLDDDPRTILCIHNTPTGRDDPDAIIVINNPSANTVHGLAEGQPPQILISSESADITQAGKKEDGFHEEEHQKARVYAEIDVGEESPSKSPPDVHRVTYAEIQQPRSGDIRHEDIEISQEEDTRLNDSIVPTTNYSDVAYWIEAQNFRREVV